MGKKHTETIDSKLKTAWQVISRMYNVEAIQHGGTTAMGYFLLNIDSNEGSFASDIAPKLGMESTSLSRIIKALEKENMILRKADKSDKRKVKLILTAQGKEKKEFAKISVRNFNNLIEQKIGKKRISDFIITINEITKLAEERNKQIKKVKT